MKPKHSIQSLLCGAVQTMLLRTLLLFESIPDCDGLSSADVLLPKSATRADRPARRSCTPYQCATLLWSDWITGESHILFTSPWVFRAQWTLVLAYAGGFAAVGLLGPTHDLAGSAIRSRSPLEDNGPAR
ncbi:hypothetical protein Hypma_000050 [Hypsizygus marmoreus]|uniref:Uncharacterized protein n=1 Tax=Hypsizygus marmoreus TaxID=39966 RepID=A0A369KH25_HYPMA|nr:hypothetical protein Hypma_000050 [Hypsizygus marmoreus]